MIQVAYQRFRSVTKREFSKLPLVQFIPRDEFSDSYQGMPLCVNAFCTKDGICIADDIGAAEQSSILVHEIFHYWIYSLGVDELIPHWFNEIGAYLTQMASCYSIREIQIVMRADYECILHFITDDRIYDAGDASIPLLICLSCFFREKYGMVVYLGILEHVTRGGKFSVVFSELVGLSVPEFLSRFSGHLLDNENEGVYQGVIGI